MGFLEILQRAKQAYDEDPEAVESTASALVRDIEKHLTAGAEPKKLYDHLVNKKMSPAIARACTVSMPGLSRW